MYLLLEAYNIEKSFADRQVLNIKDFKVYSGDRIGFVGANGCGKTTLLNILAGLSEPDSGRVERLCDISYIRQFGEPETQDIDRQRLSELGVGDKLGQEVLSGGENTRLRIAEALSGEPRLLFADEPTSNLDAGGIRTFCKFLAEAESFIIISHDRAILNEYCNKIMTLTDGDVVMYNGGFSEYAEQLRMEKERARLEYEQYISERERLNKVYSDKKAKAAKMVKSPKGMSSSERKDREFGVRTRSYEGRSKRLNASANAVLTRLEHMDAKEKPRETPRIKLDFGLTNPPGNKILLSGKDLSFSYGERVIFNQASFVVKNSSKVAVVGENGSGKTTLFNLIYSGHPSVYAVPKVKIGYFYQGFENIDFTKTVLQNAMEESVQNETIVRGILARLLFKQGDVNKLSAVLSGGERIKLSLAKLLVSGINVLLLDEPTNYLDMPSIEVLQSILEDYEGTVLFVSHDRTFANAVCTELLIVQNETLTSFEGNLDLYDEFIENPGVRRSGDRILLENKLSVLAGRIAIANPEEKGVLEAEYQETHSLLKDYR